MSRRRSRLHSREPIADASGEHFPFLLVMIALPAVAAAVVAALPKGRDLLAKQIALGVSLVVLVLAVAGDVAFDAGGDRFQLDDVLRLDPRLRRATSPSASTASRW